MLKAEKRNYAKSSPWSSTPASSASSACRYADRPIIMMKSFDLATSDRRELLLDKDRLHTIGLQFEPSWRRATVSRHADPSKAAPAEHARAEAPAAKAPAAKTPATNTEAPAE